MKREKKITKINADECAVELSGGQTTIISNEDAWIFDVIPLWASNRTNTSTTYAIHDIRFNQADGLSQRRRLYLHRVIVASKMELIEEKTISGILKGVDKLRDCHIDHINHDGLYNARCNVRRATPAQNMANRRPKHKFKGIQRTRYNRFSAAITKEGYRRHLGTFSTPQAAAACYQKAATAMWGEYAYAG